MSVIKEVTPERHPMGSIHSWTSRTQLAPYKPGNYALCRGCALSTTLTLGIVLAALQLRLRRRERVPGPSGTAWLRSQVVGTKAPVDEVSFLLHSNQSEAHIRVKRYRQSMNQGSRSNGCRFGTCTFQKLAHQIYQLTDKDKDGMAPRNKIILTSILSKEKIYITYETQRRMMLTVHRTKVNIPKAVMFECLLNTVPLCTVCSYH